MMLLMMMMMMLALLAFDAGDDGMWADANTYEFVSALVCSVNDHIYELWQQTWWSWWWTIWWLGRTMMIISNGLLTRQSAVSSMSGGVSKWHVKSQLLTDLWSANWRKHLPQQCHKWIHCQQFGSSFATSGAGGSWWRSGTNFINGNCFLQFDAENRDSAEMFLNIFITVVYAGRSCTCQQSLPQKTLLIN